MDRQRWLTFEVFAPLLGQEFTVHPPGSDPVPLVLVTADDSGRLGAAGPSGQTRTQFSIVFRGSKQAPLEQRTYLLTNPAIGRFELFVVPVRADSEGVYYEAVFG